jgi:hypothetical protein
MTNVLLRYGQIFHILEALPHIRLCTRSLLNSLIYEDFFYSVEYRMSVRKLSLFLSLPVLRRSILLTGKGGPDGGGAKLYDGEKA